MILIGLQWIGLSSMQNKVGLVAPTALRGHLRVMAQPSRKSSDIEGCVAELYNATALEYRRFRPDDLNLHSARQIV